MKLTIEKQKASDVYFEGSFYPTGREINVDFSAAFRLARSYPSSIVWEPTTYTPSLFHEKHIVNFAADVDMSSGYGGVSYHLIRDSSFTTALAGRTFGVKNYIVLGAGNRELEKNGLCLWHDQPRAIWERSPFARNVAITPFETTQIPRSWVGKINGFDGLMVPCTQNMEAMRDSGVRVPIELIHWGVDPEQFYEIERPAREMFTFGHMGALSSRKGTDLLLEAFTQAFPTERDVRLLLKTSKPVLPFPVKDKRVRVLMGEVSHFDLMEEFFKEIDCFVFPTRGEGFGLCVHPDTKLHTKSGLVPIEKVHIGEEVLSHDGKYHRIYAKTKRNVDEVYEVEAQDNKVIVSKEHPFFATKNVRKSKSKRMQWLNVQELRKGDFVSVPIPKKNAELPTIDVALLDTSLEVDMSSVWYKMGFSGTKTNAYTRVKELDSVLTKKAVERAFCHIKNKTTPTQGTLTERAFAIITEKSNRVPVPEPQKYQRFVSLDKNMLSLIGWYLAEGSGKGSAAQFSLGIKDKPYVKQIVDTVKKMGYGVQVKEYPTKISVNVTGRPFVLLMQFLCGNHAGGKHLSDCLMDSADKLMPLIHSYFLGDGHFEKNSFTLSATTKSEVLACQVKEVMLANRIYASKRQEKRNGIYVISVHGKQARDLRVSWGIKIPKKSRAGNASVLMGDFFLVPIRSIKKVDYEGEVFDIGVKETASFVGEGLLLHNTPLEAMATGVTAIVTGWAGPLEYMREDVGWLIDYNMVPATVFNEQVYKEDCGNWAEPKKEHLIELMRHAYLHQTETREKGKRAAEYVASEWKWSDKIPMYEEAVAKFA